MGIRWTAWVMAAALAGLAGCASGVREAYPPEGNAPTGTPGDLGAQYPGEADVPGRAEPRYPRLGAPGGGAVGPAAFGQWDANDDGFITRDEAQGQAIEPAFGDIDQDRDGRVSPEEFGLYQETYGPALDRPRP